MIRSEVRIRGLVNEVPTWSPQRNGNGQHITYIDISAVDQASKTIRKAQRIRTTDAPSRARQLVRTNDVLVSTVRPNLNAVAIVPHEFDGATASTGFCVLRPRVEAVAPSYLLHWVKSPHFVDEMTRLATGASYPAVTDAMVLDSKISLPPLVEQNRIAAILDVAEALREKRRQAINLMDDLRASIFVDFFGDPGLNSERWPFVTLADLISETAYGTSEKSGATGNVPVLRMNNITLGGDWAFNDLKFMDLQTSAWDRYTVKTGDLLFNRTNSKELVGKTAVFRRGDAMAFAGYLIRVRVNERSDPEYLAGFLNCSYGKRLLRKMAKNIVGMANINAQELRSVRIPAPPIALQKQFASAVHLTLTNREQHVSQLNTLDELCASLQHRAFRGEL